jgi:hypothetical protein
MVRGLRPAVPALLQVASPSPSASAGTVAGAALALATKAPVCSPHRLGVLGSGVAYLAFFRLINRWGATRTTAVAYILPVVGIALGVVVANETVDLRVIAGTALIVGGVALVNTRVLRRSLVRGPSRVPAEAAVAQAEAAS